MKAQYDKLDVIDPISVDDIDESNEWLLGEMGAESSMNVEDELVFDDDDDGLTWGVVARAAVLENQGRILDSKQNQGQAQRPQHHNQILKRKVLILMRPRKRMLMVINLVQVALKVMET